MANSNFDITIRATDKTAAARKQAEEGFNRLSRPVTRVAEAAKGFAGKSGLGGLLEKFTGLSNAGRSAVGALGEAGVAAEGLGAAAGVAGVGVGLLVAAYGAAAMASIKFAGAAGESGAAIGRTSQALGISTRDLQAFRAAGAYAGVSADAMTESFHGLGVTLNDAKWGRNAEALVMMNRLGMRLKYTKDGLIDTKAEMLDLADAIAKHKNNPQTQERIAASFGVSGALPWLRQGRAGMAKDLTQAMAAAGVATDEQIRKDLAYQRQAAELSQRWGRLKRQVGEAVMPFASWNIGAASSTLDFFLNAPERISSAWSGVSDFFSRLWPQVTAGFRSAVTWVETQIDRLRNMIREQLDKLAALVPAPVRQAAAAAAHVTANAVRAASAAVPGAQVVTAPVAKAFDAFAAAIERQESRGRQFRAPGVPLQSGAGAVGVMQLLPETAREAAARLGLAWDVNRFRTDAAYNRQLGRGELQRLLTRFGGDMTLAAAAYNAGEGRLTGWRDRRGRHHAGWLEQFGDPRKGQISDADFARLIPFKETRDYVAKTAGTVRIDINHTGAPAGVRTTVQSGGNVDVNVGHNALAGPAV